MSISTHPEPSRTSSLYALACVFTLVFMACAGSPTESGEEGESGIQYGLADEAKEARSGVELVMRYDSQQEMFTGTLTNTTSATVSNVRVEIHLSNRVELGPTSRVNMTAGQVSPVTLEANGQNFNWWSVHVEIGSSEH
ncbi:MAG: hypothetical protein F4Y39_12340 [Gemmatimonadetes bacterium]|nr:hypothetical protein [Gemmatimonadota bacterium]MYF74254.1 hypothetical protein [Gemmatimonadota bacterium]MYK54623.1 hypothetical protein [Gemmatimonadota bacterium]